MDIIINDKYKLKDDGRQFELLEFVPPGVMVKQVKTQNMVEKKSGWYSTGHYYQNLPYAVKCVARKAATSEGDCTLGEYIARLEEFEKKIEQQIGKHRTYNQS